VQGWKDVGIKLRQSSDVLVRCNCVKGNVVGVFHRRDKVDWDSSWNGYSILRDNLLKGNSEENLETYDTGPYHEPNWPGTEINTAGIYGGGYTHPRWGSAGGTLLQKVDVGAKNWRLDATESRTDVAQQCGWRKEDGTELVGETAINQNNQQANPNDPNQRIDVSNAVSGAPHPTCMADEDANCPLLTPPSGSAAVAARPVGTAPSDREGSAGPGATPALELSDLPKTLALHAPRPNPARAGVTLQLDVPESSAGWAEVTLYDVAGRRVTILLAREVAAGRQVLSWDLMDSAGRHVGSGIYFARLVARGKAVTQRVVVLK
jgi:hypothetical protein